MTNFIHSKESENDEITIKLGQWLIDVDAFGNYHLGRVKRIYVETDSYANKFMILPKTTSFLDEEEAVDYLYNDIIERDTLYELSTGEKHVPCLPIADKQALRKALKDFIAYREELDRKRAEDNGKRTEEE